MLSGDGFVGFKLNSCSKGGGVVHPKGEFTPDEASEKFQ
jgi:predicted outer membrane repeat protein